MILKNEKKITQALKVDDRVADFLFGTKHSSSFWGKADVILLNTGQTISGLYVVLSAERTGSWKVLLVLTIDARERARDG